VVDYTLPVLILVAAIAAIYVEEYIRYQRSLGLPTIGWYNILANMSPEYAIRLSGPVSYGDKYLASQHYMALEQVGIPGAKLREALTKVDEHYWCRLCKKWYDTGPDRCSCPNKILERHLLRRQVYIQSAERPTPLQFRGFNMFFTFQDMDNNRYRKQESRHRLFPFQDELIFHAEFAEANYFGKVVAGGKTIGVWFVRLMNRETRIADPIPANVLMNLQEELRALPLAEQWGKNIVRVKNAERFQQVYKKEADRVSDELVKAVDQGGLAKSAAARQNLPDEQPTIIKPSFTLPISGPLAWILGFAVLGFLIAQFGFPTGYQNFDPTTVKYALTIIGGVAGWWVHRQRQVV